MATKTRKPDRGLIDWSIEALDATGDKPESLEDAHARVAFIFTNHPERYGWQAKAIHEFLKLCPDDGAGDVKRLVALRTLQEKWGPLNSQTIFNLWRLSRLDTYEKQASKRGKRSVKTHPKQTKRTAFIGWASDHIKNGEQPHNVAAIKRLEGFDKDWGTDDTIKKWWRSIDNAPALKPGASRT